MVINIQAVGSSWRFHLLGVKSQGDKTFVRKVWQLLAVMSERLADFLLGKGFYTEYYFLQQAQIVTVL